MALELRPATLDDLDLLKSWDNKPHVIASNPNDPWDWENDLKNNAPWREPFIAEIDGIPIGFIEILDPHRDIHQYWGEVEPGIRAIDIWIGDEKYLNQGYGTKMMQLALIRCFNVPEVHSVLVDPLASNLKARHFYENLGFNYVENRTFGKDLCAVYKLERTDYGQML